MEDLAGSVVCRTSMLTESKVVIERRASTVSERRKPMMYSLMASIVMSRQLSIEPERSRRMKAKSGDLLMRILCVGAASVTAASDMARVRRATRTQAQKAV